MAGTLLAPTPADDATEVKELEGRQKMNAGKKAEEDLFIYKVVVNKNLDGAEAFVAFGTFAADGKLAVTEETGATAAASKDNLVIAFGDVDSSALRTDPDGQWFTFAAGVKDKAVLEAATTKVTKIVAGDGNETKKLLKTGNTLSTSEISIAVSEEEEESLAVTIDSAAKRATVNEAYVMTFEVNGVPSDVTVTFAAHELTANEATANVEAVTGSVVSMPNYQGTGTESERGDVAKVSFAKSGSGYNFTLTSTKYEANKEVDSVMVGKWFKNLTNDEDKKGTVVALAFKVPEGATKVSVVSSGAGDQPKVLELNDGNVDEDGNLNAVILIKSDEMGKNTKTLKITWKYGEGDGTTMGSEVTYTFNLKSMSWVEEEGAG